jgi:nucleoid-associated protein YgaU
MAEKKKGFLGGLFGGKEEEKKVEPAKAGRDEILEAKIRTDKLKRETAAKAKAQEAQKEKEKLAIKKHVVVSGDTLSGIAKKYYDDAGKYMVIYEANKKTIGDNPDLIKPGMELVIPKQ